MIIMREGEIILIELIFSGLSGSLSDYFDGHLPAIISGALILAILLSNPRFFSFEDDHEFLHIKSSSGLSPMAGNPADVNFEFQKSNVKSFQVSGRSIFKRLEISLKSPYRGNSEYQFRMSFITSGEIEEITSSLTKAINQFKQKGHSSVPSMSE